MYVLTCGEEYPTEYIISIYDRIEDAKLAADKHWLAGYNYMCERAEIKEPYKPLEWLFDEAQTIIVRYAIIHVEFNKTEFLYI